MIRSRLGWGVAVVMGLTLVLPSARGEILTVSSPAGSGGSGCAPGGTNGEILTSNGSGACSANTTGTGVLTALGVNTGTVGSILANGGALGTPLSGTGTNITGIPAANILSGALANGMTATTQTSTDNTTKLATDAFVQAVAAGGTGYNITLGNGLTTTPGTPSAQTVSSSNPSIYPILNPTTKTSNYNLAGTDVGGIFNTSGAGGAVAFNTAYGSPVEGTGQCYENDTAYTDTIVNGTTTILGAYNSSAGTVPFYQYGNGCTYFDGTSWHFVGFPGWGALSGDFTVTGAGVATLATVNSDVGSYTNANITVDAKGRVTAAANGSGGGGTVVYGSIGGLITKNDASGGTACTDVTGGAGAASTCVLDVGVGQAADSTAAEYIPKLASSFTKLLSTYNGTACTSGSTGFVSGSGKCGLPTGVSLAINTWYHVYTIDCSTGGSHGDIYFDTSPTAANIPACATYYRWIWDVLTDGNKQIIKYLQVGDDLAWVTPSGDYSSVSPPSSPTLEGPFAVPPDCNVVVRFRYLIQGNATAVALIASAAETGGALNTPSGNATSTVTGITAIQDYNSANGEAISNTSRQLLIGAQAGVSEVQIATWGYHVERDAR